jgi:phosphoserine phosphatase
MFQMIRAVVFDCDGVLSDNGSSWQLIHKQFGTGEDDGGEHQKTLEMFLDGEISEEEFVAHDIQLWRGVSPEIHRDDIMRCYSGVGLIEGAREVVEGLQKRGFFVAIVSSGVDIFVGAIANMLKVDDWVANGFEWDEDGWLVRGLPTRVFSHNKGLMVEKLARINGFEASQIISVGDSSTDLSMMIDGSHFIGFNPRRVRAKLAFEEAGVPVVNDKDLKLIWPYIFPGEQISTLDEAD